MFSRIFKKEKKDPVGEYVKSGGNEKDVVIFNALEVTDFSSQYGSETSISYTASNLAGRGNIYPSYGDFTQACVFRTYGPWWDIVPSSIKSFKRTPPSFCSQDYIELSFQRKIYPLKLEIYETYNPGCVVKILACERSEDTDVDTGHSLTRWKTLWEGEPTLAGPTSRMFCPSLEKSPFPTDLIRLELCHKLVHYYTELDYVVLYGTISQEEEEEKTMVYSRCLVSDKEGDHMTQVSMAMTQFENLNIGSKSGSPPRSEVSTSQEGSSQGKSKTLEIFSNNKLEKGSECYELGEVNVLGEMISHGEVNQQISEEFEPESDNGFFDLLPEEVIQVILSFLDVLSLCRVARSSKLLYKHSYDSLQYTELNLQPHWPQVNDIALESLHNRSRFLQRLNLSWCHGNIVSEDSFCRYIKACGQNLQDLYLSSCSFVTQISIHEISQSCPNLKELDIGSCKEIVSNGFYDISNLKHLERLNLYRTNIDQDALLRIIRSCTELKHLNLGSTNCVHVFDEILLAIGEHTKKLVSLDAWRCRTVSNVGVSALAGGCSHLEELDLGWCSDVKSSSSCLIELVKNCPNLKKLFLTANRTVCDADLLAIATYSKHMEQLDILGTRQVTADAAQKVLENCAKMTFFDVSFCSGIDNYTVEHWLREFPHVAIKKSFQN
ncbi:F-box/LRR-repeat protein 4-like [Ruditapes philippinarum]|uniref:F-box/LRR-repeat protein 4-like n=1 Tax=Ruditapes philippinarum TaxID=129788 RepID=UPI00295B47E5|nr:F-box/LRR-repeat protein 4-like [Ruditapes philippinarum]XP_060598192.1 F-box/LRR-repeat protein 4-like [Ruditapes philippinarum]